MSICVKLLDGLGSGKTTALYTPRVGKTGPFVYTQDMLSGKNAIKYLTNPCFGICMAQNVSFSGTPEKIHNGGDCVLWTASAISGTWDFTSCCQFKGGATSIDATATLNGDEALFTDSACGSIAINCYTAVTGSIYLCSLGSGGGTKNINIRLRECGTDRGCTIQLFDYICGGVTGVWQCFVIPISDFSAGAVCVNEMVIGTVNTAGLAIDYFLDCLQFECAGSPLNFSMPLCCNSVYYMNSMTIVLIDACTGTLTDGTMPKLSYNKLLAVCALSNGITIRSISQGQTTFQGTIKQLSDFLQLAPFIFDGAGSDGTNTWVKFRLEFPKPIPYFKQDGDNIFFIINDNLSGLLQFRASTMGEIVQLDQFDAS